MLTDIIQILRTALLIDAGQRAEPLSVARRRHIPAVHRPPDSSHAPRLADGLDCVRASPGHPERRWRCALPCLYSRAL